MSSKKIKHHISTYDIGDGSQNELDRYITVLANQIGVVPYIWYNANYSLKSDSGTPANATSTNVFNLGLKDNGDRFVFEAITNRINNIYNHVNGVDGTASTATGLLDVTTITTGKYRVLFNLAGGKTIACNQTQADGHFTFAAGIKLTTTANQTILTSANTGGVTITTNASSKIVFGQKSGSVVTFDTAITTSTQHIAVSLDTFTGQCILYINGKQVSANDEKKLLINFKKEGLTIGSLDGTIQNIMIMNEFLDWEKARYLAYLSAYQSNILTMPTIILTPTQETPFTVSTRQNLRNNANAPFELQTSDYITYKNTVSLFKENGGVPEVMIQPGISVNRNLWVDTDGSDTPTAGTYTIALGLGEFTFWFGGGSGSITSSNNTGVATGHGVVNSAGVGNYVTITVTTAGTFDFILTGEIQNIQIEPGVAPTVYNQRVNNNKANISNLGIAQTSGDLVIQNTGTTGNTLIIDPTAGFSLSFSSTKNNATVSNYSLDLTAGFSALFYVFLNAVPSDSTLLGELNNANAKLQVYVGATGVLSTRIFGSLSPLRLIGRSTNAGTFTTGTWQAVGLSYSGGTATTDIKIYKNNVQVDANNETIGTFSGVSTASVNYSYGQQQGTTQTTNGIFGDLFIKTGTVWSTQERTNIYNATKTKYGL